jgi:murein DD-endopeptidase MepM/ murein hydrolase activator NlpD
MSWSGTTPGSRVRALLAFGLVVALLAGGTAAVSADTRRELEAAQNRRHRVERRIDQQQRVVTELRDRMNQLAARIEIALSRLHQAERDAERARAELERARTRFEMLRERLNDRVADAFMYGFPGEVAYLLDSSSIEDMGDRLLFVDSVAGQDAEVAALVDAEAEKLAEIEARLAEILDRRQEALQSLHESRQELDGLLDQRKARIRRLAKLRSKIDQEIGKLAEKLRSELLALGGDGIFGPLYRCPVDGATAYGDTFGIIHHHPGWTHKHQGNDMMAELGTPVVAPFDGYVTRDAEANAGIYVKVTGDEGYVLMMHLMRVGHLGEVKAGTIVGWVGTTGNATAPHVHFEWHPNGGEAVDPYPQLNEVC